MTSSPPSGRSERQPSPFDSLPDALVGEVMLFVDFEERRTLALVCRRWRQLVDSPPLLRQACLSLQAVDPMGVVLVDSGDFSWVGWQAEDPLRPIRRILACLAWFKDRAAPHVEQLSASLGLLVHDDVEGNRETAIEALFDGLRDCSRLQHLSLVLNCAFVLHACHDLAPSAAAQLRSLSIECLDSVITVDEPCSPLEVADLAALTSLENLRLSSGHLTLGRAPGAGGGGMQQLQLPRPAADDSFPPSLTSLSLEGYVDMRSSVQQFVPRQITALTNLQRLALGAVTCPSGASFPSLSALSSLTALSLRQCNHLPACLPQLPQLRALQLVDSPRGVVHGGQAAHAELCSMLQQLLEAAADGQQLTHLVLDGAHQLPAEVAGLLHLQVLYWMGGGRAIQLPASGPYLTSLRRLALRSGVAASNTALLSAMPKLEALAVLGPAGNNVVTEASLVQWAAQQQGAGLRRLAVSFSSTDFAQGSWAWSQYGRGLQAEVRQLRMPPRLQVELGNDLLRELQDV